LIVLGIHFQEVDIYIHQPKNLAYPYQNQN
jgi:hypothetical protein